MRVECIQQLQIKFPPLVCLTTAIQVLTTWLPNHCNSSSHHLIAHPLQFKFPPLDCPTMNPMTSQSPTLWPSPHFDSNYEGFDHALISASERLSWQVTMGPLHKPVLNKIQVREIRLRNVVIPQHSPHYADKYQASYTTQHGTLPVTQIPNSWTTVLTTCSS